MDYFAAFKSIYPRNADWEAAEKHAKKIKLEEWPKIMEGAKRYALHCKQDCKPKKYILLPKTYLRDKRYLDEIELEEEIQTESISYTFVKAVRNKNNLTLPDLPHDLKQAFFKMGIPWGKLQTMHESELEEKFSAAYNNVQPEKEIDYKSKASGE